jgi:hydroxymethylpyrimidine pyrophosphatase-like HAD family hydrolase
MERNEKLYKLIALDVDGTLLDDHHQLLDHTKQTIRKLASESCQHNPCHG